MGTLARISDAIESFNAHVNEQAARARRDPAYGESILKRWRELRESMPTTTTPTGLELPRLALPALDEPGEVARYLHGEGLPGEFPFVSAAYKEMYLESNTEEPTRLFAGLGLAEDTNKRFHYLTKQQKTVRLSTAFDGPTLYGLDSDADGVLGKIGEGGVAIDTVEDMERLFDGFDLDKPGTSVSMTINGPAPTILAMYVAAAKRRFGPEVVSKLRGTVQADVLKEVQAQNEMLFPVDAALRLLTDMAEFCTRQMPRWYPISISGYHIAEAGATPVQQAAYTLSNGFTYVELFKQRGLDVNEFGPRLSFFLDCGLDIEYLALARVCRKVWAIAMRDVFGAAENAQRFKLHTQTSGRSLIAREFQNNLTRTAVELMMSYMNATNSCHSNSADEPFTTPAEKYVRLAAQSQAILLEESGLFKHMMNTLCGSPGMKAVEQAVERAIIAELREIDRLGGVLAAVEQRYQRSQIQLAAHRYEKQINEGVRPIIGLNRYTDENGDGHEMHLARTPRKQQQMQVARLSAFKKRNAEKSAKALDELSLVVRSGGNVFAKLIECVEVCSLGQITQRLQELVGHYRPVVQRASRFAVYNAPPMNTLADRMAKFATALRFEDLPRDVVHEVKRVVIDSLGCALGAWREEPCEVARKVASTMTANPGATVWGTRHVAPPDWAAFANGCLVRYFDYNDTYLSKEPAHPSDNIPASFCAAQSAGADGRELIAAIVIAYEVQCRLCDTSSIRSRGWDHVTYGAYSTACAGSRLMKLDEGKTRHAIGIAGVASAALRQSRVGELSHWKGVAFANAARHGIYSAMLARAGMTGPAPIFEGEKGFEKLVSGSLDSIRGPFATDAAKLVPDDGFMIRKSCIKFWPAEYHSQSAIDAAMKIRGQLKGATIESVVIESHDASVDIIGSEPEKWRPQNRETADHSLPYITAAALVDGEITSKQFSPQRFTEPKLIDFVQRVKVVRNAELSGMYPGAVANIVTAKTSDGRTLTQRVDYPPGHAMNRLSDEQLLGKYHALADPVIGKDRAKAAADWVWKLDEAREVGALMPLIEVKS